jgi:hypothetical protein
VKKRIALEDIQAAGQSVADAQRELAAVLRDIQAGARAEKTTISDALRKAFDKLRAAREHLLALEMVARGKDQ